MEANEKLNPIIFLKGERRDISLVLIQQFYFKV